MKYLFALMDDETRFWIAQEVAESKYKHDARRLFQLGVKATGKRPMTLIIDGLPAYHDAYKREFWTMRKDTRTEHVSAIKLSGNMNNNKMERFNGEIRDREKTMRGLKTKDILHVKQLLGHKRIDSTLVYAQLVTFENDDYHSATAKTAAEGQKLIESGFDFVCTTPENIMLFRKRK